MRSAYANWFWKLPGSLLLIALALLIGQSRRGAFAFLRPLFLAAGAAMLLDSFKDRAVFELSRSIYESTPDTMPDAS